MEDTPHGTKPILTDSRRALLEGEYEGKDESSYAEKTRIRHSTEDSLHELRMVAESDLIDNASAFDRKAFIDMVEALMEFEDEPSDLQTALFHELHIVLQDVSDQSDLDSPMMALLDGASDLAELMLEGGESSSFMGDDENQQNVNQYMNSEEE